MQQTITKQSFFNTKIFKRSDAKLNLVVPKVDNKKKVSFDESKNTLSETHHPEDYDRSTWEKTRLTRETLYEIRMELDEVKTNMEVHPKSIHNTVFYLKRNPAKENEECMKRKIFRFKR